MKIALAQVNFHIGNFENNKKKILDFISRAKDQNADLIVFPELALSGYPPLDFLEYKHFSLELFVKMNLILLVIKLLPKAGTIKSS